VRIVTGATSPNSDTRSVVEASAAVRALVNRDPLALRWLDTNVSWPTLVYAEVAHTTLRLHRHGTATRPRANAILAALYAVPADARPVELLVREAWGIALDRGLTVYDSTYVVLAEALDVPLVTADRRLAAATPNSVLL
jgi:predicted nucleic acid-binding protein